MGLPNDSPRDLRVADCPDKFTGARDLQQRPVHLVGIAGPGRASGPGSGWDVAMKEVPAPIWPQLAPPRSEEHTSELQSLMRISYAVFCLKKKNKNSQQLTR